MNDKYRGAEWIRVDLHLHSPFVKSFKLPSGINLDSDKEKIVRDYVRKIKEKGIQIGAITDYNGIQKEWFIPIRDEAEKEGILILPGVELSISLTGGKYGLHLIVIFDNTIDIDGLNTFLHSLDKDPQEKLLNGREHREINSKYELEEMVKLIREKYKCLIIFAHPEEDKGLFKTFSPKESAKYISIIRPDALEYFSNDWKSRLVDTNEIKKELLERIAILESSDPKSIDEIGNKLRDRKIRATYLKLSDFSLSALKLALHDPEVRVKLYKPPEMFHSRITRVTINGTTFLKDLNLNINPELNTFIGGRGVGKSAIIESIRYCLDLPVYAEESQKIDFVYAVVGSGGEISVEIDKYVGTKKTSYKISRIIGKEPEVYMEHNVKLDYKPSDIFEKGKEPIIIGQKELYHISQDESFLLQLIDQFIGDRIKEKQKEFENCKFKLEENGRKILDLEKKLFKKDEYEQLLRRIESKIKEYEKLGVAQKLERYTNILEDDEKINSAYEKFREIIQNIETALNQSSQELSEIILSLKRGKSEKKEMLEKLASEFENAKKKIEEVQLVPELDYIYKTKIKATIEKWNTEKAKFEKEIENVKKKLGEEKLQPEKLEELTKQKAKIESLLRDFKKYEENLENLKNERIQLREEVKRLRYELFKIRKEEIQEINKKLNGKVNINVTYEGEKKGFKKYITNILQGSGIHKDAIDSLVDAKGITIDGILISDIIAEGKDKVIEKFGLTEKMAERLIEYFKDKNKLFELETLFPEDLIEIQLNVDGKC